MRILPALTLAALLATPAQAEDRLRAPPMLRGDLDVGYSGGFDVGSLRDRRVEGDRWEEVARSVRQRHGLQVAGAFSPYHGLTVLLDVPVVFHQRRTWASANTVSWDSVAQRPVAVDRPSLSREERNGSASARTLRGLGELGIGLRGLPFAQQGVPGRQAAATLSLEAMLRLPSGGNFNTVRDDGTAGPGTGGATVELAAVFSRRIRTMEPYAAFEASLRAPYRVALFDSDGAELPADDPAGARLDPADELCLRVGNELLLLDRPAQDARGVLDLRAALRYVGPDEVSSGTLLPAELPGTAGHVAVRSEHVVVELGLGLRLRTRSQAELRVDLAATWTSPHTQERLGPGAYSIRTGPNSFGVSGGLGVRVRLR